MADTPVNPLAGGMGFSAGTPSAVQHQTGTRVELQLTTRVPDVLAAKAVYSAPIVIWG